MSGICGIIRLDGKAVQKSVVLTMLNAMKNRGNDDEGLWLKASMGFGHKMLWTTPESLHEKQPQVSKDATVILTADVRIDNRDELFKQFDLNENDHDIITDTDLIIWSYQKWSENCPKYIVGDYAFALWDEKQKQLFCSRSPLGIKPFYYHLDQDFFIFASEIAVIQSIAPKHVQEPDIASIKSFINTTVISCQKTCFNGINRLIPAHNLIIQNKQISQQRFWFPEKIKIDNNISFEDAKKMFLDVMTQAVQCRLRSAYPIGCELSGGLDSSTVLTLAAGIESTQKVSPLSSYYDDLSCDEQPYIESVAKKLNIKPIINRALSLDYKGDYSLERHYQLSSDWPGSGSFLDALGVFRLAQRNNIRVVLTGQGGDHIAAGNYFMLADYLKSFRFIHLYKEMLSLNFSWRMFKQYALSPLFPAYFKRAIRRIAGTSVKKEMSQTDLCYTEKNQKGGSQAQAFDLAIITGALSTLCIDFSPQFRAGHFNIECWHPFFDQRVIEFMLSLPASYKMKGGLSKILLREAMKGKIPDIVYERGDKAEFSPIINYQMKFLISKQLLNFTYILKYNMVERSELIALKNSYVENDGVVSIAKLKTWRLLYIETWLGFIEEKRC